MPAVSNGAELVKALRESGTPDRRLTPARECLSRVYESEHRVASAAEVVAVLERELGADNGTVGKARMLLEAGQVAAPKPAVLIIEDLLLASPPEPKSAAKPAEAGAKGAPKKPAE